MKISSLILTASIGLNVGSLSAQVFSDSAGNVGIGTTAPNSKLTIVNNSSSLRDAVNILSPSLGSHWSHIHWGPNGDWYVRSASSSGNVILQDHAGRVGIGTASPTAKLELTVPQVNIRMGEAPAPDGWSRDGMTVTANPGVNFSSFRVFSGHNAVADRGLVSVERQSQSCFFVRMDGAVGIGTRAPAAKLDVAGEIRCTTLQLTSDRTVKGGFQPVNPAETLTKVAQLPVTTWHYLETPDVEHLGPMAQDFHAAFGLGDDRHISVVDGLGVALSAIQGLHAQLESTQDTLRTRDAQVKSLQEEMAVLRGEISNRMARIERAMESTDVPVRGERRAESSLTLVRHSR